MTLLLGLANISSAQTLPVKVDCTLSLGAAEQINDFMNAGGVSMNLCGLQSLPVTPEHPFFKAWRRAGMQRPDLGSIDFTGNDPNFLTRDVSGNIQVNFGGEDKPGSYDWFMWIATDPIMLNSRPAVYLGNRPKMLSAMPDDKWYGECMPANLDDWEQFIRKIVRHNVRDLGLRGLSYGSTSEPDWDPASYHKMYASPDDTPVVSLPRSIELFAVTYRVVHEEDPSPKVKVGSERASYWQHLDGMAFTLKEWLIALRDRNLKLPADQQAKPDCLCWQDYHYPGASWNLAEGAEYMRKFLPEITDPATGVPYFDPNIPFTLDDGSGNGSWACGYWDTSHPHQNAAHVAYNLMREFKAGTAGRKFDTASFFLFALPRGFDDGYGSTYHSALMSYNEDWSQIHYTSTYAVFEVMKALKDIGPKAQIVSTSADAPLEVMATYSSYPALAINNNTDQARDATVKVHLPDNFPSTQVTPHIQRIDEHNSNDTQGLESGQQWESLGVNDDGEGRKWVEFSLTGGHAITPYSTVLVRLVPKK